MGQMIQPPLTPLNAAQFNLGLSTMDDSWKRSFSSEVSTFLSKARSAPSIVEACFGADCANKRMQDWFTGLAADEQSRRREFSKQFQPDQKAFRKHYLTTERDVSEHRLGYPNIETKLDAPLPSPLRPPRQDQFTIAGKPLFSECHEYLLLAQQLVNKARTISESVHGDKTLSAPPSS